MVIKYYMLILGDGGEDVSCRIENQHLSLEGDGNGSFPANYVDKFLDELKCFFLEGLVFPNPLFIFCTCIYELIQSV